MTIEIKVSLALSQAFFKCICHHPETFVMVVGQPKLGLQYDAGLLFRSVSVLVSLRVFISFCGSQFDVTGVGEVHEVMIGHHKSHEKGIA